MSSTNQLLAWIPNLDGSSSFVIVLALAFLGGLLTCLTPCVYPVIPLSVGQMSRWRVSGRRRTLLLSGLFAGSMAGAYTLLGLLAGFGNLLFGSWFSSPWIKLAAGGLIWLFAAGLLGVYRFRLPDSLVQWSAKDRGPGAWGALATGALAGVLSAGCTGPILAGILIYIGTNTGPAEGTAIMAAYSLGLALPFFFLGAIFSKIPRSGPWLVWAEAAAGFGLVAVGSWMVASSLEILGWHGLASLLWVGIGLGLAALVVWIGLSARRAMRPKWAALLTGLAAAGATLAFLRPAPPRDEAWHHVVSDAAFREAVASAKGRPVLLKFSADWCPDCQKVERTVYRRPDVREALQSSGVVLLHVDATKGAAALQETARALEVPGVPAVRLLDAAGKEVRSARLDGPYDRGDLLRVLQKAQRAR